VESTPDKKNDLDINNVYLEGVVYEIISTTHNFIGSGDENKRKMDEKDRGEHVRHSRKEDEEGNNGDGGKEDNFLGA